jgi:hypothetical protein
LYEFLTGAMPFTAQTIPELASRILGEAPPDVRLLRADVPASLAVTVNQCLEKDLERRIPNVGVFAQKLEECAPATSRVSVDRIERVLGMTSSRAPGALPSRAPSGSAPTHFSGSAPSPAASSQNAHGVVRPSGATLPTAVLETGRAQAISVATPEQKKKSGTLTKVSLLGAALIALVAGAYALRNSARIGPESAASAPTLAAGAAAMPHSSALDLVRPLPEPAVAPLPATSAAGALPAASDSAAAPSASASPSLPAAPTKRARPRPTDAAAAAAAERSAPAKPPPKPQPNPLEMPLK